MIGGALCRITGAQLFISSRAVSVAFLLRLVLLQLVLIPLVLALILLLLRLIFGIIGIGLGIGGGIAGRDLVVDRRRLGLFFRCGMGGGHAVGIHSVAAGRGVATLGKDRRNNQGRGKGKTARSGQKRDLHGAKLL